MGAPGRQARTKFRLNLVNEFPVGYTIMLAGAGSGIGRATALRLSANGVAVHAYDRDPAGLAALKRDSDGVPIQTHTLDVTDDDAVTEAVGSLIGLSLIHI